MNQNRFIYNNSCFQKPKTRLKITRNRNTIVSNLPWRTISSGVITRPDSLETINLEDQNNLENNGKKIETPVTNFLGNFSFNEKLRTPIRKYKAKTNQVGDTSKMTRQCENLFSQVISKRGKIKDEPMVDPSFSVQRIIKGSGLLKSFGTGHSLDMNDTGETNDNQLPYMEYKMSPPTERDTITSFNLDDFMNHNGPISEVSLFSNAFQSTTQPDSDIADDPPKHPSEDRNEYLTDNAETDNSLNRSRTPIFFPPSSPHSPPQFGPSPDFFDTVVLQKTIETEVFEYFPMGPNPQEHVTIEKQSPQRRCCSVPKRRKRRRRKRKIRFSQCPSTTAGDTSSGYDASSSDHSSQ